uniref:MFS domain-containing protein n=1 Tax=Rhabditophanes sp. KR3021 TaxID=114890 RepID=A0AC35U1Z3_9BILA
MVEENQPGEDVSVGFRNVNDILEKIGISNLRILFISGTTASLWIVSSLLVFLPVFVDDKVYCGQVGNYSCNPRLANSVSLKDRFNPPEFERHWFDQSFYIGSILGTSFVSYLADIYGRKFIGVPSFTLIGIFGLLMRFSPNYHILCFLRFAQGILFAAAGEVIYVLASESVPHSNHPVLALVFNLFWALGCCLLSVMSLIWVNWDELIFYSSLPVTLLPILLWFVIPESLAYLFEKKKGPEIEKWLSKVNKVVDEKKRIEYNVRECIDTFHHPIDGEFGECDNGNRFLKFIRFYKNHPKFIFYNAGTCYVWSAGFLLYLAMTMNSTSLSGNPYWNFILASLVELPPSLAAPILLKRYGRKIPMIWSTSIVAVMSFALIFINESQYVLYITVYMTTKGVMAFNYICLFVYFSEIYPTEVRNTSLGLNNAIGNCGGLLSPMFSEWSKKDPKTVFILYVFISASCAIVVKFLPETSDPSLLQKQTYEDRRHLEQNSSS